MNVNKPYNLCLYLLVFTVGATRFFDLTLVGRVPLSEIIAFGAIPFLMSGVPWSRFSQRMRTVLILLGLWILGVIVSDFVNTFEMSRFVRGIAKPVWCFLWLLFFVGVIHRDFRALLWYPAGVVVASLQNYFFPQSWTIDRIEAGGYGAVAYGITPMLTATALFLSVLVYRKSRLVAVLIMLLTGVGLLAVEAPRSAAALYFLNALILLYIAWTKRQGVKVIRLTLPKLATLGVFALLGAWLIFEAYVFSAYQGWLGEFQRGKIILQSQTIFGDSLLGLILGGRTAVFGAILAILDQPLLGYGSGSGLMLTEYFYDAVAFVGTDSYMLAKLAAMGWNAAPGHSIFFGAWMENGILAAVAIGGIGLLVLHEFLAVIQRDSRVAPLLVVLATSFFWAFLFSPFGTVHRLAIGLFMAFYVMAFHRNDGKGAQQQSPPGPR